MSPSNCSENLRSPRVLSSSAKSLVVRECQNGVPIVRKKLVTDEPFWRKAFRTETIILEKLSHDTRYQSLAPVLHSVIDTEMTMSYIDGAVLAKNKYADHTIEPMVRQAVELAQTIQSRGLTCAVPAIDALQLLEYGAARSVISSKGVSLLDEILAKCAWVLNHGDFLPRNIINPRDACRSLVAIDWELACLAPAGYDIVTFWLSLLFVPDTRRHFSLNYLRREYLPALLLVALREIRTAIEAAHTWSTAGRVAPLLDTIAKCCASLILNDSSRDRVGPYLERAISNS